VEDIEGVHFPHVLEKEIEKSSARHV
jgi:hypothetical protein